MSLLLLLLLKLLLLLLSWLLSLWLLSHATNSMNIGKKDSLRFTHFLWRDHSQNNAPQIFWVIHSTKSHGFYYWFLRLGFCLATYVRVKPVWESLLIQKHFLDEVIFPTCEMNLFSILRNPSCLVNTNISEMGENIAVKNDILKKMVCTVKHLVFCEFDISKNSKD